MRLVRRAETGRELASLLCMVAEVLEGYLSCERFLLRTMESKPQAELPSPKHQGQEEVPM